MRVLRGLLLAVLLGASTAAPAAAGPQQHTPTEELAVFNRAGAELYATLAEHETTADQQAVRASTSFVRNLDGVAGAQDIDRAAATAEADINTWARDYTTAVATAETGMEDLCARTTSSLNAGTSPAHAEALGHVEQRCDVSAAELGALQGNIERVRQERTRAVRDEAERLRADMPETVRPVTQIRTDAGLPAEPPATPTPAAAATGGQLPFTGAGLVLPGAAAALTVLGAGLLLLQVRRRASRPRPVTQEDA
jgi:hypothetical protein